MATPSGFEHWFFFHDPQGRLLAEFRQAEGQAPAIHEHVHLGSIPLYQKTSVEGAGVLELFFVPNQLGQPVVGLTPDCTVLYRADVDAFGWTAEQKEEGLHQPLRSVGQYEDRETRVAIFDPGCYGGGTECPIMVLKPPLHYNWHRYYDPLVGYYLKPDPAGQHFDVNPYRFVRHDPVNLFDPNGRHPLAQALGQLLANAIGQAGAATGALGALTGGGGIVNALGGEEGLMNRFRPVPIPEERPEARPDTKPIPAPPDDPDQCNFTGNKKEVLPGEPGYKEWIDVDPPAPGPYRPREPECPDDAKVLNCEYRCQDGTTCWSQERRVCRPAVTYYSCKMLNELNSTE